MISLCQPELSPISRPTKISRIRKTITITTVRLRHCVYYGASTLPQCERHLHGEIVSFGVLCLLTYDGQIKERDRIMQFNKSVGLPVTLDELEISKEDLTKIADKAESVVEWTYVPGTPTKEKFIRAMIDTDTAGKKLVL